MGMENILCNLRFGLLDSFQMNASLWNLSIASYLKPPFGFEG